MIEWIYSRPWVHIRSVSFRRVLHKSEEDYGLRTPSLEKIRFHCQPVIISHIISYLKYLRCTVLA